MATFYDFRGRRVAVLAAFALATCVPTRAFVAPIGQNAAVAPANILPSGSICQQARSVIEAEFLQGEGDAETKSMVNDALSPWSGRIQDAEDVNKPSLDCEPVKSSTDPKPVLVSLCEQFVPDLKPALGAATLATVLMMAPDTAQAAMSGGRMGGTFASPAPTMRSMPARSYGGGMGYGSGLGYRGGAYRTRTYISPGFRGAGVMPYPAVAPMIPISPFVTPMRPLVMNGPGAIAYNRGPSLFDLLFIGGIGFFILNTIRSASAGNFPSSFEDFTPSMGQAISTPLETGTSVAQVSVALEVPNRDDPNSILSVLNRIAQTAKTDSRRGIQNLTSQVALELLRQKTSIVSGATRYKHFRDRQGAERDFNTLSIKERSKFEQETASQYGGVATFLGTKKSNSSNLTSQATLAVVTLMLNIDGDSTKLPTINNIKDVEEALRKIAADARVGDCLQAAEILWTPEDRSEALSTRDVVADYPELAAV